MTKYGLKGSGETFWEIPKFQILRKLFHYAHSIVINFPFVFFHVTRTLNLYPTDSQITQTQ